MKHLEFAGRIRERLIRDPTSLNPSQRLLALLRGHLSPALVRPSQTSEDDIGRTLLITGFPRSGTTWLAEIVSSIPRAGLVFEPLDIRRVTRAQQAGCEWENFVPPTTDWPIGRDFLGAVLSGQVLTPWTASQLPVLQARQVDRWVVKLVRGNQMLAWIIENFDLPAPVLLVRHPCAVYDSWIRRGWPVRSAPPRQDLLFFEAYPEYRRIVEGLTTPEEYFAAEWAMQHVSPMRQLVEGSYQLCYYEKLRGDGSAEIQRIFSRWGIDLPLKLEQSLNRPSAKASGDAKVRATSRQPSWMKRLDKSLKSRMMRVLELFEVDLYEASGRPRPQ